MLTRPKLIAPFQIALIVVSPVFLIAQNKVKVGKRHSMQLDKRFGRYKSARRRITIHGCTAYQRIKYLSWERWRVAATLIHQQLALLMDRAVDDLMYSSLRSVTSAGCTLS